MSEKGSFRLPSSYATPNTNARSWPARIVSTIVVGGLLIWSAQTLHLSHIPWTSIPSSKLSPGAKVLTKHPLIDGHNDFLIFARFAYNGHVYSDNFTHDLEQGGMPAEFDLPRARAGHLGGTFWSAFAPCPADGFDFSDANYAASVKFTLEQFDLFNRIAERWPQYFTLSRTAAEAEQAWKAGRLISPLIIEGLHQIGNSLATLRLYHELGVRYATLSWNCHNKYVDAAMVVVDGVTRKSEPYHAGVSKAGRDLILEMNRLGMMVDLSHVSDDTMRDVLGGSPEKGWKGSIAPPIFSHSSARALCPHPRNVPDDILQLVKQRESVVMINFAPDFISCKDVGAETGVPAFVDETNTLEQVVRHIMHIGELIGYDYVGIGSDFDGIPNVPRGLEDVSKFPDLFDALLAKGVSEEDAGKVAGRNILRVWHEVDRVAARLQKEIHPVEDDLS